MEAGTKEALKWLNNTYAAGLLAKDFPVASAEQVMRSLLEDHVGVMAMTGNEVTHATGSS